MTISGRDASWDISFIEPNVDEGESTSGASTQGGNGSSCFQAELGRDKIPPPAFRISPRLNIIGKEIIKRKNE